MSEQQQEYKPQWGKPTRLIVAVCLIVAGVYALTLVVPVLQMLVIAFLIAFLMLTPARLLTTHTLLPYSLSVILIYILLLIIFLIVLLILIPAFIQGANNLIQDVQEGVLELEERLEEYTPEQGVITVIGLPLDMDFILTPLRNLMLNMEPSQVSETDVEVQPGFLEGVNLRELFNSIFSIAGTVTVTVTSTITSITGLLASLLLGLFISFLVLVDFPNTQASLVKAVPQAYHREYALLTARMERVWIGFFRGQVTIGVVIGLLTWLELKLLGVPGAEILAIFTGFISLIPTLGGFIALVPLFIVPLVQGSMVLTDMSHLIFALLVIGINLVITQIIWNVVAPMILGDALNLPLPVVIVGVFIGAAAGGVLGAFLVAPIISMLRVIVGYLFSKINGNDPFPGEEPHVPLGAGFFGQAHRRNQAEDKQFEAAADAPGE